MFIRKSSFVQQNLKVYLLTFLLITTSLVLSYKTLNSYKKQNVAHVIMNGHLVDTAKIIDFLDTSLFRQIKFNKIEKNDFQSNRLKDLENHILNYFNHEQIKEQNLIFNQYITSYNLVVEHISNSENKLAIKVYNTEYREKTKRVIQYLDSLKKLVSDRLSESLFFDFNSLLFQEPLFYLLFLLAFILVLIYFKTSLLYSKQLKNNEQGLEKQRELKLLNVKLKENLKTIQEEHQDKCLIIKSLLETIENVSNGIQVLLSSSDKLISSTDHSPLMHIRIIDFLKDLKRLKNEKVIQYQVINQKLEKLKLLIKDMKPINDNLLEASINYKLNKNNSLINMEATEELLRKNKKLEKVILSFNDISLSEQLFEQASILSNIEQGLKSFNQQHLEILEGLDALFKKIKEKDETIRKHLADFLKQLTKLTNKEEIERQLKHENNLTN